ncbi:MAG TPA: hypothetical protein VM008_04160 [Phycisphaerae bacterium]|nr:hypothetical protein [Phycisphaerae bacterium]
MSSRFIVALVAGSLSFASCTESPGRRDSHLHPPTAPPAPIRVLFIGNSLTYTNDLPGMLEKMSATEAPPLHCEAVTFPGVSLAFHRFVPAASLKLKSHPWDFVILQDYSTRPLDHPEATTASVRAFLASIHAAGARPILFENWTRRNRVDAFPLLQAHYDQISRNTGVPLARIGEAWDLARRQLPWFAPYVDERHPSRMGSYLAACVLFESLYSRPPTTAFLPRGLPQQQAAALANIATSLPPAPPSPPRLTTTTSR